MSLKNKSCGFNDCLCLVYSDRKAYLITSTADSRDGFLLMDMLLNKTARETNLVLIWAQFRGGIAFCSRKQL